MFARKDDPHKRKYYREELLYDITRKNRRAIQAWFRRNHKSVSQAEDIMEYINKFSPYARDKY